MSKVLMIDLVIRDDDVRHKGIDMCQGSQGRSSEKKI